MAGILTSGVLDFGPYPCHFPRSSWKKEQHEPACGEIKGRHIGDQSGGESCVKEDTGALGIWVMVSQSSPGLSFGVSMTHTLLASVS